MCPGRPLKHRTAAFLVALCHRVCVPAASCACMPGRPASQARPATAIRTRRRGQCQCDDAVALSVGTCVLSRTLQRPTTVCVSAGRAGPIRPTAVHFVRPASGDPRRMLGKGWFAINRLSDQRRRYRAWSGGGSTINRQLVRFTCTCLQHDCMYVLHVHLSCTPVNRSMFSPAWLSSSRVRWPCARARRLRGSYGCTSSACGSP
jgi:hypothetical protein